MTEAATAAGVVGRETRDVRVATSPAWLADRRRAAWDAFSAMPAPSSSRDEDWRRTDIARLHLDRFGAAGAPAADLLDLARSRHATALPAAALILSGADGSTIVENAEAISGWAKSLASVSIPSPPVWVDSIPLVGQKIAVAWQQFAAYGPEEFAARIAPYEEQATRWMLTQLGGVGAMFIEFVLTVMIAAVLYSSGENAIAAVRRFACRLAGPQGEAAVTLAGQAIRGIALGVIVTALAQSVLGGIGLAVAGVPFVVLLAAIIFLLSIVQIGPLPVLVICVGWLYWNGHTGWAIGLLVWSVLVDRLNSVLLPILVRRGVDLSLILVLVGVIGGLIAFGLIGIFIGPVVLAVSYKLLDAWVSHEAEDAARLDDAQAMTTKNVEAKAFSVEEPTKSDT